jgi:hypothetical protein
MSDMQGGMKPWPGTTAPASSCSMSPRRWAAEGSCGNKHGVCFNQLNGRRSFLQRVHWQLHAYHNGPMGTAAGCHCRKLVRCSSAGSWGRKQLSRCGSAAVVPMCPQLCRPMAHLGCKVDLCQRLGGVQVGIQAAPAGAIACVRDRGACRGWQRTQAGGLLGCLPARGARPSHVPVHSSCFGPAWPHQWHTTLPSCTPLIRPQH